MPEEITRRVHASVWNLGVHPGAYLGVAKHWERLGGSLRSRADSLVERGTNLLGPDWSGLTRDSYEDFRSRLITTLDEAAELAETYDSRLCDLADRAETTQEALSANRGLISDLPASRQHTGTYYLFTLEAALADAFEALVSEARTLNQNFFSALYDLSDGLVQRWANVARDWEGVGLGTTDPFVLPEAPPGTQVLTVDGETIISTGPGDDQVQIRHEDGRILVTVNGVVYSYPAGAAITIRGGSGDDTIEVEDGIGAGVTVLGGKGDDTVTGAGTVFGGKGDDRLFGTAGDDYLSGGSGNDYLEGRDGEDVILAGAGGDTIYAGDGFDIISNPDGSSYIDTGPGNDRVYSGESAHLLEPDTFVATDNPSRVLGEGFVTRYEPTDIDLSFLNIEGSPEFVARVEADMRTLSRYMGDVLYGVQETPLDGSRSDLTRLSHHQNGNLWAGGHTITIREASPDSDFTVQRETSTSFWGNRSTVIHYNPVYHGPHEVTPAERYRPAEYGSPVVQLAQELKAEGEAWGDW